MRAVIFVILCVFSFSSQAVFISAPDGRTYDVGIIGGERFESIGPAFGISLFPWWGNLALAEFIAGAITNTEGFLLGEATQYLGTDDFCVAVACGPVVAYGGQFDSNFVGDLNFVSNSEQFGVFQFSDDSIERYDYVVATVVPTPAMMPLVVLGFSLIGWTRKSR